MLQSVCYNEMVYQTTTYTITLQPEDEWWLARMQLSKFVWLQTYNGRIRIAFLQH